ncbi:MAG: phosphatase PAP2 family protein [Bacteroidota bacterium]
MKSPHSAAPRITPPERPNQPVNGKLALIREFTKYLHSADILMISFLAILSVINIAFVSRIPHWGLLIGINIAMTGFILWLGFARHRCGYKILRVVHDWYVAPMVFLSFKELYWMIKPIHFGRDYDDILIAIDRWIFGVDPTHWLMHLSTPWLTEILQIAYTAFYLLFIILGYEIYRRKMYDMFHFFMFTCVYGFFLSYLGYLLLPAVGPRFTLHDFSTLDTDLPGLWLTPYLRWFVNWGESVAMHVPNSVAIASAQRDVFPSGHTMMTLVLMHLSARAKAKVRWIVYSVGTLLIIATVYERYHYVVDLFGGALFAALCILTSRRFYHFTRDKLQTLERQFPSEV